MSLSLEIFAPRARAGEAQLATNILRDAEALGVVIYVSISGNDDAVLRLAASTREHKLRPQIQLQCGPGQPSELDDSLKRALAAGISSVLLLGDDPGSTLETVKHVKARHGAAVSIAVCGFPRGTTGRYEECLAGVRAAIAAGADRVVAMPVLEAAVALQYVTDLGQVGGTCTVQPSLLPVHAFGGVAELQRVARSLGIHVPDALRTQLCALPSGPFRAAGHEHFLTQLRRLMAGTTSPVHVAVLNSAAVMDSLRVADLGGAPKGRSLDAAPDRIQDAERGAHLMRHVAVVAVIVIAAAAGTRIWMAKR